LDVKGGLISEVILTLVTLPTKGAKSLPRAENLNQLFIFMGRKFKFSAQGNVKDKSPVVLFHGITSPYSYFEEI
jgi:hypothetical protein